MSREAGGCCKELRHDRATRQREENSSGLWLPTPYPQLLHLHLPAFQNQEQDLQRWKWEGTRSMLLQVIPSSVQKGSKGSKEHSCPCNAKHQNGSQGHEHRFLLVHLRARQVAPQRWGLSSENQGEVLVPTKLLKEQLKTKRQFCLNHNSCAKFTSIFLL